MSDWFARWWDAVWIQQTRSRLEFPSPNLTPDENGEICCPSCGRMVGEGDFGRGDICKACERGLT